jgi:Holin of 3TMs, for gene-transfer release
MDLIGIGSIIEGVGKVAGDLITTDKEKLQMALEDRKLDLEEKKIDQATDLAQVEVNKIEAASSNFFVSGWRPAVGWVGVLGLAYQFLGYPLMQWLWAFGQGYDIISKGLNPPPDLDVEQLMTLLAGLLGFGGMRSFEKHKGVASK